MYTNDRNAYRQAFANTWQKHLKKLPLDAMETEVLAVILLHTEYHGLLEGTMKQDEFEPEENPFIHLSLHMAIREQIRMDRPSGVKSIYETLQATHANTHDVEHLMLSVLAKLMWQTQQTGNPPDEETYLAKLRELVISI